MTISRVITPSLATRANTQQVEFFLNTLTNQVGYCDVLGAFIPVGLNQPVSLPYASSTTGINTYIANALPQPNKPLIFGQAFNVKFSASNTGASTINMNGTGNKSILNASGLPTVIGDIVVGETLLIVYNGSNFQIVGQASTVSGSTLLRFKTVVSSAAFRNSFTTPVLLLPPPGIGKFYAPLNSSFALKKAVGVVPYNFLSGVISVEYGIPLNGDSIFSTGFTSFNTTDSALFFGVFNTPTDDVTNQGIYLHSNESDSSTGDSSITIAFDYVIQDVN